MSAQILSQVRHPRGLVLVNGQPVDFIEWQVENSTYYQADTFEVTLPLGDTPATVQANFSFWAGITGKVRVEVLGGFPENPQSYSKADLTSFILGDTDEIELDPLNNQLVLYGRDLSASLIDTKITEKLQNQTSSQIATQLAQRNGLQSAITPTTTPSGTYYKADHVNLSSDRTEWDLLTALAQLEGFEVYVRGNTLHFEQPNITDTFDLDLQPPRAQDSMFWSSNAEHVAVNRHMTLARDVMVTVRSWNQKSKAAFTETAFRAAPLEAGATPMPPLKYFFTRANLTSQQAKKIAIDKLNEITRHEIVLTADLPADTTLSTRSKLRVRGTNTPLDQGYYSYSVRRTLSNADGFRCTLEARNQSAENGAVVTDSAGLP